MVFGAITSGVSLATSLIGTFYSTNDFLNNQAKICLSKNTQRNLGDWEYEVLQVKFNTIVGYIKSEDASPKAADYFYKMIQEVENKFEGKRYCNFNEQCKDWDKKAKEKNTCEKYCWDYVIQSKSSNSMPDFNPNCQIHAKICQDHPESCRLYTFPEILNLVKDDAYNQICDTVWGSGQLKNEHLGEVGYKKFKDDLVDFMIESEGVIDAFSIGLK